jgi:hypothetical protein
LQGLEQPPIDPTEEEGQKEKEDKRVAGEHALARTGRLQGSGGGHDEAPLYRDGSRQPRLKLYNATTIASIGTRGIAQMSAFRYCLVLLGSCDLL